MHYQTRLARHLFGRLDLYDRNAAAFERGAAAFCQGKLRVDLIEMLLRHEVDARTGGRKYICG